jgi:hypothetical protein
MRRAFAAVAPIAVMLVLIAQASGRSEATILTATLTGPYLHAPASAGSGTARITFTADKVCWKFTFKGLVGPGDSGIHRAPPPALGVHKTAILPFETPTTMKPGCVSESPARIKLVLANPGNYYVSIGSKKYPKGAIGGKLHRS